MKRKFAIVAILFSVVVSTGCSMPNIPFLSKGSETSTEENESGITPEQEALIGTYTEDGSLITGFDEDGWMITESPDQSVVTQNELGLTPTELLSQQSQATKIVVTTYTSERKPIRLTEYNFDSKSNIGLKYSWTENSIGMTYYDKSKGKAYVNEGMSGWTENINERMQDLIVYINPAKFVEESFTSDDAFIYITGKEDKSAIDRTILMNEIYEQFPNVQELSVTALFNREDNSLYRAEVNVTDIDGLQYIVAAVPTLVQQDISIPENVYHERTAEEVVKESIVNIPARAYLYSALYQIEDSSIINRDFITEAYNLIRSKLEKSYNGLDLDTFIGIIQEVGNNMTVEEFLTDYAAKAASYDSIDQNAAYDYIYDRLKDVDSSLNQEDFDKMIVKPEESDEPVEETVEEPTIEIKIMKTTTAVNKRSGPSTSYDKLGKTAVGEEVQVVGVAEEDPDWSKCIDAEGNEYYLKSVYLVE